MTKSLKYSPTRDEVLKALGAVSETEYKKLEQQLAIATKALKDLELANDIRICMKAQEAIEKMKGVK